MRGHGALLFAAILAVAGALTAVPPATAQSTVRVTIPQGAGQPSGAPGYVPDTITVVIGVNNTVVWVNDDNGPETGAAHTVTSVSGNGTLSSGYIAENANYTFTFTAPGTYDYYCTYHSWMTGTVIVLAPAAPVPEFPASSLAVILFVVVAAVMVAESRLPR